MSDLAEVWSNGGGTQSVCIAVLVLTGRLPKPDIGVIVDTTRETSTTWAYFENYVQPALAKIGVNITRISSMEWNEKRSKLFHDYADTSRESDLLIPAFSTRYSEVGKLSNYCTGRWKVEARDKWLRAIHGLTRSQFRIWIGFSRDEVTRAVKMMAGEEYKAGLIRFPLIHDVLTTRQEAIKIVKDYGWPEPPRSACWMCPNHHNSEWLKLKREQPKEFELACNLEKEIQQRDPDAWLHRSCVPLSEVDFDLPDLFSRPCDSGVCFV